MWVIKNCVCSCGYCISNFFKNLFVLSSIYLKSNIFKEKNFGMIIVLF